MAHVVAAERASCAGKMARPVALHAEQETSSLDAPRCQDDLMGLDANVPAWSSNGQALDCLPILSEIKINHSTVQANLDPLGLLQPLAMNQDHARFRCPPFDEIVSQPCGDLLPERLLESIVAAQEIFAGRSVPRSDLIMAKRPIRLGNKIPAHEIDVVVGDAAPAPCPRRSPEGTADRDLHRSVAACIGDLCTALRRCCRIDVKRP